jgi:Spy/CpxP family protein refolding chaperone
MKPNLGARTQAVVLLLLVATAGALAGVVVDRLISDRSAAGPAPPAEAAAGPWRWEPRVDVRYGERLYGALELSAEQRSAIDGIIAEQQVRIRELNEEVRPRFRSIAEQTRGRIEAVLTDEQRERLRELREARARTMRENSRSRGLRPDRMPGVHDTTGAGGPLPRDGALRERLRRDGLRGPAARDSAVRERRGGQPPSAPLPRAPSPATRSPTEASSRRITLSF